jgi:hypothetical protein
MAGLDPAIPLNMAPPCLVYRDRRVKPGDDGSGSELTPPKSKDGRARPAISILKGLRQSVTIVN